MRSDLNSRPLLVYWELTRACELACRHCRAEAAPERDPGELSLEEGLRLLDALRGFGEPLPHIVLTGGDPLKRSDLWEIIAAARERGFTVAITPSGTYALTPEIVRRFRSAGIWMMGLSLDGSTAERHDSVRMVPGSFVQSVQAAEWAREAALPIQVNTLVCEQTADDLRGVYDLVAGLGAARWSLFFLVHVGRGRGLAQVGPEQSEALMHELLAMAGEGRLDIKTTEAPHYRRVALQAGSAAADGLRRAFGIWDGSGIMFISHTGDVCPAGFLPLAAGNVRETSPVEVYRSSELFTRLRDPGQLQGRCGVCQYRRICGGSRARAYATTGDPLESDPLCPYEPGNEAIEAI
ncbi:MAG TPA: radical SAM protein [Chthonomonadales bacterium]|nr:radical SAM protein [Chthonomonadales bacterium]